MLRRKINLTFIGLGAAFFLSACSMDASILDLSESVSEIIYNFKTSNKEIVAGSQQDVVTAQNYKVQSSFTYQGGTNEVITAKKYKVKTNVQATLYNE